MVDTGYRVVQVRVIFKLPPALINRYLDGDATVPEFFAYVELFSRVPTAAERNHGLYRIKREHENDHRAVRIIPLASISRSVQLLPKFGPAAPRSWSSSTVLDECETFFINTFSDRHIYYTLQ